MPQTIYRPVPGFDDLYAGADGTIVKAGHGALAQSVFQGSHYLTVSIPGEGDRHTRHVHALVAAAFLGERPKGIVTRHGPGGKLDNRIGNLCYGTQSDNMHDSVIDKTHPSSTKTHCPRGHEYTPENTRIDTASGSRRCRTCRAAEAKRYQSTPEHRARHAELKRLRRRGGK